MGASKWGRVGFLAAFVAAQAVVAAPLANAQPATGPPPPQEWVQAVCNYPDVKNVLVFPQVNDPAASRVFPSARSTAWCFNYYPMEKIGDRGGSYDIRITFASYLSQPDAQSDLDGMRKFAFPTVAAAAVKSPGNAIWMVVAQASTIDYVPPGVEDLALQYLSELKQFGFKVLRYNR